MPAPLPSMRYPAWLLWLIGIPLAIAATLLAVFFFTLFLMFFVLALAVIALRIWWLQRKLRRAPGSEVIEGEYSVVRKSERLPDSVKTKGPP